jgi:hypothetical protein
MHAKVVSLCGEQPRRENAQRDGRLGAMAERQKRSAVMSDDTRVFRHLRRTDLILGC